MVPQMRTSGNNRCRIFQAQMTFITHWPPPHLIHQLTLEEHLRRLSQSIMLKVYKVNGKVKYITIVEYFLYDTHL